MRARIDLDRSGTLGLMAALLVVVALAPLAMAQVPEAFDVEILPSTTQATAPSDGCAVLSFQIRNSGASPIPATHQITLALSQPSAGWTVRNAPPPAVNLAPGATSDSISFQLCPPADGERAATTTTLTATVESDPRAPKPVATQEFTADVEGGGLFGLDIPVTFLWIALGGVGVIIALVLVTRRRPTAGVAVSCPEPAKEVTPGRGTSFPIRIRNEGRDRDVVSLSTSPVPRGWDTFLPLVDIPLEAREEQTVWLSVKSPDDAHPGDRVVVKVIARSSSGGGEQAAIDTLTTVRTDGAEPPVEFETAREPAEESVYRPEDSEPRPVAVKRRKA